MRRPSRILKSRVVPVVASAALATAVALPATAQMNDNWVTVVVQAETDTIDPCMAPRSGAGRVVMQNVNETLVERDAVTGDLMPRLATSWEQVDDRTWRFTLRQGVTFHDGAPLNGETAAKSINRTMDKELTCEIRVKTFSGIDVTAKAVGEYEVEIQADQPVPILPVRASSLVLQSPNTPVGEFTLEPIGTGPYKFEGWNAGVDIVLSRNEDYWGEKPVVEGARYIWRSESAVRASMVKLGEADLAPNIAVQDANDPSMDLSYLNSETTYLRIDNLAPLTDVRIRRALNYAFDRHSVHGSIMSKDVIHATQMVVPGMSGHNAELDKNLYPFDPDKARELIAEAKADGVPVDNEIRLIVRAGLFPGANEVMEAMHAMYTNVGLNVTLVNRDEVGGRALSTKPYPPDRLPGLQQSSHDNNKGDPVFSMTFKYGCEGPQSKICSPELDAIIDQASRTPAGPERAALWRQSMEMIYEDLVPEVWLFHMVGYARINPRIDFKPDLTTNSEVKLETISFN